MSDQCPVNRIDCQIEDGVNQNYDPSTGPPREDCELCWRHYNLEHDLPLENREAKSNFRPTEWKGGSYLTNWLPDDIAPIWNGQQPNNATEFASDWYDEHPEYDPVVMGLDISMTSTGFALFWTDGDRVRFVSDALGWSVPNDAPPEDFENLKYNLVRQAIQFYDAVDGDAHDLPIWSEDHAYSMGPGQSMRLAQTHEIHGAMKLQLYLKTGRAVRTVKPSTMASDVFGNGRADKDARLQALRRSGYEWSEGLTDDEVDAWGVCASRVRSYSLSTLYNART